MTTLGVRGSTLLIASSLVIALGLLGCDPADGLDNQEYRPYLDNYERWDVADVVASFNHLDTKREQFDCQKQLEAAQRASWREKAGTIKVEQLPEGKALEECVNVFHKASGLGMGKIQGAVLSHWISHNFSPEIQARIDAEDGAAQKRLEAATCGGEECQALTVVDDLAVPRAGLEVSVAWQDAVDRCDAANFGGIGPWRLPTRDELVNLRMSNKLATDEGNASYWSGTREFDGAGKLGAYVLRFDLASLGKNLEPKLMPFETEDRVTLAKVRCVHDLSKGTPPATEVDQMEKILVGAGCPRNDWDQRGNRWWEFVRYRDGVLVMWKATGKRGAALTAACRDIRYCGLTWKAPNAAQAKKIADDAWLQEGAAERCVAELPGS